MAIFAISDLHLSLGTNKPMDIFGTRWQNYEERLKNAWEKSVSEKDTVLIAGDISWAMHLEDALEDLRYINALPGQKILVKGNHDYWWGTNGKVESFLKSEGLFRIDLIKNNAYLSNGHLICGTRGWILPGHIEFKQHDRIIFEREVGRLERSIKAGLAMREKKDTEIIVMIHYPPIAEDGCATALSEVMEKHNVTQCVYGHLHGRGHTRAFEGIKNGVKYSLTSADYIAFKPLRL